MNPPTDDHVVIPLRRTEAEAVDADVRRSAAGITIAPEAAEAIAKLFHETYERLAPAFGYETRKASSVPWESVPANNRALMTATCGALLERLTDAILPVRYVVDTPAGPVTDIDPAAMWQIPGDGPQVGNVVSATGLTTDPTDPRLTHGVDAEPVGQAPVYLVLDPVHPDRKLHRPVRTSYRHVRGAACGVVTTMSLGIAETYARDPKFYGATYCTGCRMHLDVVEFDWVPRIGEDIPVDQRRVGS